MKCRQMRKERGESHGVGHEFLGIRAGYIRLPRPASQLSRASRLQQQHMSTTITLNIMSADDQAFLDIVSS
jgi:hypothetical protein